MGVAEVFQVINTDARFSSLRARRHLLPEAFSHTGPDPGARVIPEESLLFFSGCPPPFLLRSAAVRLFSRDSSEVSRHVHEGRS